MFKRLPVGRPLREDEFVRERAPRQLLLAKGAAQRIDYASCPLSYLVDDYEETAK